MGNDDAAGEPASVAQLVDHLFATHRREDGREYTYQEISKETKGELTPGYLSKLRSGQIADPGRYRLLLLCRFFRVPASYFFPELKEFEESYSPPESEPPSSADTQLFVALRAAGIPEKVQKYIAGIVAAFRAEQQRQNRDK